MRPIELPILRTCSTTPSGSSSINCSRRCTNCTTPRGAVQQIVQQSRCCSLILHPFQFPNHPLDHTQAALPELRLACIKSEGLEQFRVMLGAAGREHREVTLGEAFVRFLVDRIER